MREMRFQSLSGFWWGFCSGCGIAVRFCVVARVSAVPHHAPHFRRFYRPPQPDEIPAFARPIPDPADRQGLGHNRDPRLLPEREVINLSKITLVPADEDRVLRQELSASDPFRLFSARFT